MDTRKYLQGEASDGYKFFGNHKIDKNSYIFRTLAPNAKNLYVVGDFNGWREEKLRKYSTGIFSKTIKNVKEFDKYLYVIEDMNGKKSHKLDPFAKISDDKNSLVFDKTYKFSYKIKENRNLNIYEMKFDKEVFEDEKKIVEFIKYLKENNFTHLKAMMIFSNYFQSMGRDIRKSFFSVNKNLVDLEKLKKFIDLLHKNNIGIIFDIDISGFSPCDKGLIKFDGSNIYNYDYYDILYSYNGMVNFDPSKYIVKSYVLSFITYLIDEFNIDGISLENLENLIFWQGDKSRGYNEFWIEFISIINSHIKSFKRLSLGSYNSIWKEDLNLDLGFSYIYDRSLDKIIKIMQKYPIERDRYSYIVKNLIENDYKNFLLGFNYFDSLSEGASLAMKINSDNKKYQQLKTLFLLVYSLNSKKILFMEDEFGSLETYYSDKKINFKIRNNQEDDFNKFYKKISKFYKENKELYKNDAITKIIEIEGYSLYAFKRMYKNNEFLVVINLTDLDYNINFSKKTETILTSFKEISIKNNNLFIPAFGSGIFKIK